MARADRIATVPNAITLLRLALVPVVAYALATRAYAVALPVFLVAALSDAADGFIARRYHLKSRLGAALDPVADKLNMLVATLMLAWQAQLPPWLAVAIVARDVLIVAGALAYRAVIGQIRIAPTRLSKLNTVLEFALLLVVMGGAARWIETTPWIGAAFVLVGATVVASGVQYGWLWGSKARRQRRAR
jgi:cardiolipin synthase